MSKNDITAEEIRALLDYNSDTGVFTWRERTEMPGRERYDRAWNAKHSGKTAGSVWRGKSGRQCINIMVRRKLFYAHRLAFLWMAGRWPIGEIDHIDRDSMNNSWGNLRESFHYQNMSNTEIRSNNALGVKGVRKMTNGRYRAQIQSKGTNHHLGYFDTPEEANAAYREAAKRIHGEFACLS